MTQSWLEAEFQDRWTLSAEELALLPGMTDKGRLGFALQLKFIQIHGRFPEQHQEIDPNATLCIARQLGALNATLSSYELDGRQGRRHRQAIRRYLGFRPATAADLERLGHWLHEEVLPFDPQAQHGTDSALAWCRTQGLEPPAMEHLGRIIRSAVHRFETHHQEGIFARLSDVSKAAIDQLLAAEEPESAVPEPDDNEAVSFSDLKADPGKPGVESLLTSIAKLQCIDGLGLSVSVFEPVPAKFIERFRQRCASESIRELRRHPPVIRYSMVAMFCWRRRQQLTDLLLVLEFGDMRDCGRGWTPLCGSALARQEGWARGLLQDRGSDICKRVAELTAAVRLCSSIRSPRGSDRRDRRRAAPS